VSVVKYVESDNQYRLELDLVHLPSLTALHQMTTISPIHSHTSSSSCCCSCGSSCSSSLAVDHYLA